MIEIRLKTEPHILIQTLERIGIHSTRRFNGDGGKVDTVEVITPTVYFFPGRENKKYLIHFKEWFLISRPSRAYDNMGQEDRDRLGFIAGVLAHQGLIDCDPTQIIETCTRISVVSEADLPKYLVNHKIPKLNVLRWSERGVRGANDGQFDQINIDQIMEKL